jgi:hypothetical protein
LLNNRNNQTKEKIMKKSIRKTVIVLAGVLAIALVFVNPLLAQETMGGNLITDADLAFITADTQGTVAPYMAPVAESFNSLITASDLTFVTKPFSEIAGNTRPVDTEETIGLITMADYQFLTGGQPVTFFSGFEDFADSLAGRMDQ